MLVGVAGFEPATLCSQSRCATWLRHTPNRAGGSNLLIQCYFFLLPWFEGRPIADIEVHDVRRWFASLHSTPASADRSAPILSVIMHRAEIYGYRPAGTNPCTDIRRYRRRGRERFLSTPEIRLHDRRHSYTSMRRRAVDRCSDIRTRR